MNNRNSWSSSLATWGVKPGTGGSSSTLAAPSTTASAPAALPRPTNAADTFETFRKQAERKQAEQKQYMSLLKQSAEEDTTRKGHAEKAKAVRYVIFLFCFIEPLWLVIQINKIIIICNHFCCTLFYCFLLRATTPVLEMP